MAKTPAKKTARIKKTVAAASAPVAGEKKARRLKKPQYKSFRPHKHIKSEGHTVPSAFHLLRSSVGVLVRNWKLFVAISAMYGLLNFVLVQGLTVQSLQETKEALNNVASGDWSWFLSGMSLFATLLGSSASESVNPGATAYQVIIQIIVSLAIIWALRQVYAGHAVRIRDGFYQGVYPLVPFLLVLVTMALQAIPGAAGVYLYSVVNGSGIAATVPEQILWAMVAFLAVLLSLYLICSSVIALYVVSLPNIGPVTALRSAAQLVQFRRWAVLRKVLLLPVILLAAGLLLLMPIILFATPAAPWAYLVLSMFVLPIAHSYLYALYRSLL